MALVTCPECGGKVSDQAEACPHCGFLLKARLSLSGDKGAVPGRRVTTIEATGKEYKLMVLAGTVLFVAGLGCCVTCNWNTGEWLVALGLLLLVTGKTLGWWHHG